MAKISTMKLKSADQSIQFHKPFSAGRICLIFNRRGQFTLKIV